MTRLDFQLHSGDHLDAAVLRVIRKNPSAAIWQLCCDKNLSSYALEKLSSQLREGGFTVRYQLVFGRVYCLYWLLSIHKPSPSQLVKPPQELAANVGFRLNQYFRMRWLTEMSLGESIGD